MPNTYIKRSEWNQQKQTVDNIVKLIEEMTGDFLQKEKELANEIEEKRIEINDLIESMNANMTKIKNEIEEMFK